MREDGVRKQWDESAESWTDFVRSGKDYSRDEMNNPVMFEVLGDIRGKRILDLGCGEGYNSRIMAKKEAKVIGIDFSRRIIDLAIQMEEMDNLGIEYHVLDACNMHIFRDESFDIVACFMALQDIDDYESAVKETSRVLKGQGRFVFVIPHPCFETKEIDGEIIGGWEFREGSKEKSSENALFLKVDRYFDKGERLIPWKMERLEHHFETTSFHRTLTDYANALHAAGLAISRLKEPKPSERGLEKYPVYFGKSLRIPDFIVIETLKS